jgi:hypothetical protein
MSRMWFDIFPFVSDGITAALMFQRSKAASISCPSQHGIQKNVWHVSAKTIGGMAQCVSKDRAGLGYGLGHARIYSQLLLGNPVG